MLSAGDNATLPSGTTVTAGTTVTVNVDTVTAGNTTGGTLNFAGDIDATLATFNGDTFVDGGGNDDTFNVTPDQDAGTDELTPIEVYGFAPIVAPGDELNMDITGLTDPTLTIGQIANNGRFTFSNAASVTYNSIETVNAIPAGNPYNLVVDLTDPDFNPLADGLDNHLDVQLNDLGTQLEIIFTNDLGGGGTPVTVFTGDDDFINSLTVIGSSDADELHILPNANGQLPTEGGGFAGSGHRCPCKRAASR